MTATILRGDALALPIADESVDLIVTSPPYFALRSYTDAGEHYLVGIPWRYAIRCIDDLGLILRAEVIWSKPNGLPESVTDRVRRSHEQWFHFTKEPRYYSAVDEVREAHSDPTGNARYAGRYAGTGNPDRGDKGAQWVEANPLGKLPGSVWTIATEPLRVPDHLGIDHFAAFPTEFPRRIIAGWSPRDVCTVCGQGRRPVIKREQDTQGRTTNGAQSTARRHESIGFGVRTVSSTSITGYACRHGISVDLSGDYCRLAQWRTTDPRQRAKAARVDPVEPVPHGQLALFEEVS